MTTPNERKRRAVGEIPLLVPLHRGRRETRPPRPDARAVCAVGYVRVSTREQADGGHSIDAQREKIEAYATLHDMTLSETIVDDGHSAKSLKRPGMERLLAMVGKRRTQCVIVAKLDRITRSVRDLGELVERFEKARVQFASVADHIDTSTASGRLVLNVMGSVAQWERETIAERTADALAHLRANGRRVGRFAQYGYRLGADGTLVEDAHEKAGVRLMADLRAQGASYQRIARALEAAGHLSRSGRRLSAKTIRAILSRQ